MNGKDAAPLQYPQGLPQQRLLVRAGDVVVDVVAGHCVEGLIREIQMAGVALLEGDVAHPLCPGIPLTEFPAVGCVFHAPAVDAHHAARGVPFGTGDGQRPAAAPHIQAHAALRKFNVCGDALDDLPGQLPPALVGKHLAGVQAPRRPRQTSHSAQAQGRSGKMLCRPAQGQP